MESRPDTASSSPTTMLLEHWTNGGIDQSRASYLARGALPPPIDPRVLKIEIMALSHQIWVSEGRPKDKEAEHWLLAESTVKRRYCEPITMVERLLGYQAPHPLPFAVKCEICGKVMKDCGICIPRVQVDTHIKDGKGRPAMWYSIKYKARGLEATKEGSNRENCTVIVAGGCLLVTCAPCGGIKENIPSMWEEYYDLTY